jgi:EmrB/QacA subfamily drug resistance transporter
MTLVPHAEPQSGPPTGPRGARRPPRPAYLPADRHGGSGLPPKPDGAQHARRRATLAVICAAALIINVDNTILNVALPTLVRDLHATTGELQWIVDSYAMVFAGLLLVGGSVADRFGRKRFFLAGLVVFAGGSACAAFCGSVDLLIAWRAVMGAGAALTIPASLSIINDVFRDPAQRARAIGAWAATIGLGIAIGPIAGGLLLTRFWWGSVFLVNVPIATVAFAGSLLLVPDSKNPAASRPDPAGALLSIAGLGLLLWAIIEAPTQGWASAQVTGAGLAGLAVLGIFVAWEARSRHPMLKLGFFRDRRFSIAAAGELLGIFGLMGALFLQTQMLQFGFGYSPLQAGLRILPVAAVLCVIAPLSPAIARVIGIKFTVAAGLAAIAGGLWQNSAASTAAAHYAGFLPGMLLIGLGAGLLLPTATNSVVGAVPRGDSGVGSATNAVALQVGGALGVAIIGSVLSTRYQARMTAALAGRHLPAAVTHAILGSLGGALTVAGNAGGATGALLAQAARDAFMSGNQTATATAAAVAVGGAVLMLARMPSRTTRHAPDPGTDTPQRPGGPATPSPADRPAKE